MNLFEMINDLYKNDRGYWDYYDGITVNPIQYPKKSNEFINEFFSLGSKEWVLGNKFHDAEDDSLILRNSHTTKVFFIGIYLQQKLNKYLSINAGVGTNYPFSYLWYLSCLFHDFGYRFEEKRIKLDCFRRLEQKSIKRSYNSRLDYYRIIGTAIKFVTPNIPINNRCYLEMATIRNVKKSKKPYKMCNRQCNGIITFSNNKQILNSYYINAVKNNYFKYRIFEHNRIDHGIAGADYMYCKLIQNYRIQYSKMHECENPMEFTDANNRHYNCEQFKIFAYISDCIACHNIWKAPKDSEELYQKYELEALIGENFKIVSYENNPLLFILCLADSIEPTKKIKNIDESEILKNIELEYCVEANKLKVLINKKLNTNNQCRNYIENLKSIEDWIDIKIEVILI